MYKPICDHTANQSINQFFVIYWSDREECSLLHWSKQLQKCTKPIFNLANWQAI